MSQPATISTPAESAVDVLRVFNSALVASRASNAKRDFTGELMELVESPAFQSILGAVSDLAVRKNLREREAAEELIQTFRKVDQIWQEYLIQEGADRVLKT